SGVGGGGPAEVRRDVPAGGDAGGPLGPRPAPHAVRGHGRRVDGGAGRDRRRLTPARGRPAPSGWAGGAAGGAARLRTAPAGSSAGCAAPATPARAPPSPSPASSPRRTGTPPPCHRTAAAGPRPARS